MRGTADTIVILLKQVLDILRKETAKIPFGIYSSFISIEKKYNFTSLI